jgi:uncharacterized membrane protein YuzA (DUF378 family)
MDTLFWSKKIQLVCIGLLVIGALNWGLVGVAGIDVVAAIFGSSKATGARIVYILIGLAALVMGFRRDTYLPFLGETVLPCSMMPEQVPEHADTEVTVSGLDPGAKVLYWATEPATEGLARIKDWRRAYLQFANAGVTTADSTGRATLRVRKPQPYTVPIKGPLPAHVHWRVCGDGGMLGPVQTTTLDGGAL